MNINFFEDEKYECSIFFTIDEFGEDVLFSATYDSLHLLYCRILYNNSLIDRIFLFSKKFNLYCCNNEIQYNCIYISFNNYKIEIQIDMMKRIKDTIVSAVLFVNEEQSNELVNKLIEYFIENIKDKIE